MYLYVPLANKTKPTNAASNVATHNVAKNQRIFRTKIPELQKNLMSKKFGAYKTILATLARITTHAEITAFLKRIFLLLFGEMRRHDLRKKTASHEQ